MSYIASLPLWFTMPIIGGFALAIIYRLVKHGIKIKVGSAEIDATDEAEHKGIQE
jgi:hypothetical protein